jgi:hypothetical protein
MLKIYRVDNQSELQKGKKLFVQIKQMRTFASLSTGPWNVCLNTT